MVLLGTQGKTVVISSFQLQIFYSIQLSQNNDKKELLETFLLAFVE